MTMNADAEAKAAVRSNSIAAATAAWLPFADVANEDLPLGRLLRLSLFQISVGMALVLLTGTLNRVMIVELGAPAALVAIIVSLPLVFAPLRALIGHRSDTHQSLLGWRRGPYIWFGSMLQFGGFAIMPFSLLVLTDGPPALEWVGLATACLSFLLVGAGMHTTQTAGLALAGDISSDEARPRVVALLYFMLLVGMVISALIFGFLLKDFTPVKLIQTVQGAAVATIVLNVIALWKQEAQDKALTAPGRERESFALSWRSFAQRPGAKRLLVAVGLGAAGFSMQDVLLEPYGAEVLGLAVNETTMLTALFALGTIAGFILAARKLANASEPHRIGGYAALAGALAFAGIILSAPINSVYVFCFSVAGVGFSGGLFSVATLTALMALADKDQNGIALGAWGAVQATCAGVAIALGGLIRDILARLSADGLLGPALANVETAYAVVYHVEILLLFFTLVAIGPLARYTQLKPEGNSKFGLAAFPQ